MQCQSTHPTVAMGVHGQQHGSASTGPAVSVALQRPGPVSGLEVCQGTVHPRPPIRAPPSIYSARVWVVCTICTLGAFVLTLPLPLALTLHPPARRFSDGLLENTGSGLCVDFGGGGMDPGRVSPCNASSPTQLWSLQVVTKACLSH